MDKFDELFAKETAPLADNGFTARVMVRIPTAAMNFLRRLFIQGLAFILGAIACALSGGPFEKSGELLESAAELPDYFANPSGMMIAAAFAVAMFAFALFDLPAPVKKVSA